MKAMLFAAGLGSRLKPFTDKHPKALATVNGKTLLELNINYLERFGVNEVVVNVHHFGDQIIDILEKNRGFGLVYHVSDETDEVLETGGGLKKAAGFFKGEEPFVVMNVDVLTNLDLGKMIETHRQSEALATLAVMKRNSSRQLLFDEHMILCGWMNTNTGEQKIAREVLALEAFAFSGIQILSPAFLDMPFTGKFSIIQVYLHFAKTHLIKGFDHSNDIFIDAGKPETLLEASQLFP